MKVLSRKIIVFLLTAALLTAAAVPAMAATEAPSKSRTEASVISATALTSGNILAKSIAFAVDARWKNGVSWPQRSPKLSKWSSKGCCAYAADFCKYVYGYDWVTKTSRFKKYTNVNNIQAGDIIHTSGHWFVVLKKSGGKLYTAEGAYSSKARVSTAKPGYYIENGKLYQCWYNSKTTKLKYKAVSMVYAYHFS